MKRSLTEHRGNKASLPSLYLKCPVTCTAVQITLILYATSSLLIG